MARVKSRVRRDDEVPASRSNRTIAFGLVALVLILAVLGLIWVGLTGGGSSVSTAEQFEGIAVDRTFLGEPDAPLLIREFADFKCPHCRDASEDLLPDVIEQYVATGQARLEVIPVAVLGDESVRAAEAVLCAADQGQFWPYHDVLFERQARDSFQLDTLTGYARDVGMDEDEFRNCLASGRNRQIVQANQQEFVSVGATGTPSFIVGNQMIPGAVPFADMQAVIESELGN